MGYFQVRYDSRVVIYERKMFIRFATGVSVTTLTVHDKRSLLWLLMKGKRVQVEVIYL